MADRQSQVKEYFEYERKLTSATEDAVEDAVDYWRRVCVNRYEEINRNMIRHFVKQLGIRVVKEAMDIANFREVKSNFGYFVGVCRNKMEQRDNG